MTNDEALKRMLAVPRYCAFARKELGVDKLDILPHPSGGYVSSEDYDFAVACFRGLLCSTNGGEAHE
jgi:hypothetical protein